MALGPIGYAPAGGEPSTASVADLGSTAESRHYVQLPTRTGKQEHFGSIGEEKQGSIRRRPRGLTAKSDVLEMA